MILLRFLLPRLFLLQLPYSNYSSTIYCSSISSSSSSSPSLLFPPLFLFRFYSIQEQDGVEICSSSAFSTAISHFLFSSPFSSYFAISYSYFPHQYRPTIPLLSSRFPLPTPISSISTPPQHLPPLPSTPSLSHHPCLSSKQGRPSPPETMMYFPPCFRFPPCFQNFLDSLENF